MTAEQLAELDALLAAPVLDLTGSRSTGFFDLVRSASVALKQAWADLAGVRESESMLDSCADVYQERAFAAESALKGSVARLAKAEELLRPFAEYRYANEELTHLSPTERDALPMGHGHGSPNYGDCRAAAAFLAESTTAADPKENK